MADNREMEEYGRASVTSDNIEKHEKSSSDDERKKYDPNDLNPYQNASFSSKTEAKEYERKKANALLANPLRGYSDAELRTMGREYALGKNSRYHLKNLAATNSTIRTCSRRAGRLQSL
jgi:hypothetical protein